MTPARPLAGILAAAPTPFRSDLSVDLAAIPALLDHLVRLGCDGALLAGTTGEGPSLGVGERIAVIEAAAAWRAARGLPDFGLLAGTGCAAIPDSVAITRAAFDLGADGVLLLPAYYFKAVTPAGLTAYFSRVIEAAVPPRGQVYIYHFPQVTGIPIPVEAMSDLAAAFPEQIAGMKDSGADLAHTRRLIAAFPRLAIFTGTDSHLADVLEAGGPGSITALANLCGDIARDVLAAFRGGRDPAPARARLDAARAALEDFPTVAAVKAMLADIHGLPPWPVRPPLEGFGGDDRAALAARLQAVASPPRESS